QQPTCRYVIPGESHTTRAEQLEGGHTVAAGIALGLDCHPRESDDVTAGTQRSRSSRDVQRPFCAAWWPAGWWALTSPVEGNRPGRAALYRKEAQRSARHPCRVLDRIGGTSPGEAVPRPDQASPQVHHE